MPACVKSNLLWCYTECSLLLQTAGVPQHGALQWRSRRQYWATSSPPENGWTGEYPKPHNTEPGSHIPTLGEDRGRARKGGLHPAFNWWCRGAWHAGGLRDPEVDAGASGRRREEAAGGATEGHEDQDSAGPHRGERVLQQRKGKTLWLHHHRLRVSGILWSLSTHCHRRVEATTLMCSSQLHVIVYCCIHKLPAALLDLILHTSIPSVRWLCSVTLKCL